VTFIVTPNLEVPVKRLKQWKCSSRLRQEKYKLIDESAFFSEAHETNILTKCHKNGFIGAAINAFRSHYPLEVKPVHFWLLIMQGIAEHVNQNAEELRTKWVDHEGQVGLTVKRDSFVLGKPGNDWQGCVDGQPDSFTVQMKKFLAPGVE
jgi:hypothetical protein